MYRSFIRSTAPIALLLTLGICTTPALLVMPASTTMVSDGVQTTTGPDVGTLVLAGSLTAVGLLAFAAAGLLAVTRYRRRRAPRV
jgi:EamA domain-containing membrane protein RarD